jgi:hypothetical protein
MNGSRINPRRESKLTPVTIRKPYPYAAGREVSGEREEREVCIVCTINKIYNTS